MLLTDQKRLLRRKYQSIRKNINDSASKEQLINTFIVQFLEDLQLDKKAQSVAGYYAVKDEVNCKPALKKMADNYTIALPYINEPCCTDGKPEAMTFRQWNGQDTELGYYNIPTATGDAIVPDIILIPLLAFDKQGVRLGYGGGYYDRILNSEMLKIGIGFSAQEAETLPKEAHDILLNYIITENGVMKIA